MRNKELLGRLLIFVVLIILSINTSKAYAAEKKWDTFTYNKMTMKIIKTASSKKAGEVSISSFSNKKSTDKLIIPSEIKYNAKEYKVTCIESFAFKNSKFMQLSLPDNIKINYQGFKNCTNLTSLSIPQNVNIGAQAFWGCTNLKSVEIEEGITTIPFSAFNGCINLSTVSIPDSVKIIDNFAFSKCYNLQKIVLPETVTEIRQDAFSNCKNLTSINFPSLLKKIGSYAFKNCSSLETINIPKNVVDIGNDVFIGCNKLIVTIPKYSLLEKYFIDNNMSYNYSDETVFSVEPIEAYVSSNSTYFYKITNNTSTTYNDFHIEYILIDTEGAQMGGGSGGSIPIFRSGESHIFSATAENITFSDIKIINYTNNVKYDDMSSYIGASLNVSDTADPYTNKESLINITSNSPNKIDMILVQIIFYKDNKIIGITGSYFYNVYKGTTAQPIWLSGSNQYTDYKINVFACNYKH